MKKDISEKMSTTDNDMLPEYDFSGGVRGKHYKAMRRGYTVKIQKSNGTTVVQHFNLKEGAVMLEPEVQKYFPDSEAVNTALRCLIPLVSTRRGAKDKS